MKRLVRVGVALACLSFLAGCSDSSSTSQAGSAESPPFTVSGQPVETTQVELPKSYKFEPAVIQVAPGATVTWTNRDDFPHNIRLRSGPDADQTSENIGIGQTVRITFDEAGTYYYDCSLHPGQMKGKVVVEG